MNQRSYLLSTFECNSATFRIASREGLTPSPTCQAWARWFPQGDAATSATKRVARDCQPSSGNRWRFFYIKTQNRARQTSHEARTVHLICTIEPRASIWALDGRERAHVSALPRQGRATAPRGRAMGPRPEACGGARRAGGSRSDLCPDL